MKEDTRNYVKSEFPPAALRYVFLLNLSRALLLLFPPYIFTSSSFARHYTKHHRRRTLCSRNSGTRAVLQNVTTAEILPAYSRRCTSQFYARSAFFSGRYLCACISFSACVHTSIFRICPDRAHHFCFWMNDSHGCCVP